MLPEHMRQHWVGISFVTDLPIVSRKMEVV